MTGSKGKAFVDSKVLGDVDGDGTADFSILVVGVHDLGATDFVP